MDMRQKIEDSGRDNRWEFDRQKLFARTRYMALRCGDLLSVAEMLRDMRAMLGSELKAVTGNAKGIDEVMARVEAAVVPLEQAPFDLFDRRYQTSWEAAMGKFRENVAAIEEMLKKFMDESFTKLRSAEDTFNLLQKFRSIQENEASSKLMSTKTLDILQQYDKELQHVQVHPGRVSRACIQGASRASISGVSHPHVPPRSTSSPSTTRAPLCARTSRRSPARSTGRTRSSCASARRWRSSRRWTS